MIVSTLRQSFVTRILELDGWAVDAVPFSVFGRSPRPLRTKLFAVGVDVTVDARGTRQRKDDVMYVLTTTIVRFAYKTSPKNPVESMDSGFEAADELIKQLMRSSGAWPGQKSVIFDSMTATYGDEFSFYDVNFGVYHNFTLAS